MIARWPDGCRWAVEGYTVQQHMDAVGASDQGTLMSVDRMGGGKCRVRRENEMLRSQGKGSSSTSVSLVEFPVINQPQQRVMSITTSAMSDRHKRITEQWMVACAMQYATGTYSKEEFSKEKANFMKGEFMREARKEREGASRGPVYHLLKEQELEELNMDEPPKEEEEAEEEEEEEDEEE